MMITSGIVIGVNGVNLVNESNAKVPSEQWNKTLGGYDWDGAEAVIQTSDGGYAIVGRTRSYGAGDFDAWLIKIATPPEIPVEVIVSVKSPLEVQEGKEFPVTVIVNNVSDLAILMFELTYNPSVINLINIEKGSDISDWSHWQCSVVPGIVTVSASSDPSGSPIDGSAELAELKFKVVGEAGDKSAIDIQGIAGNSDVEPIIAEWVDCEVAVTSGT